MSERSTGSDAEHGLFATETYRAPRCRSPADDERLAEPPSSSVVFLFALSVVVDDLLVQRTGLQRRKRRCSSTARHLILGIGMSWACARAPRASCTGRGASETGHHVSGCADGHRSSQRLRESAVNTFFLCAPGPGGGSGVGPGPGPRRPIWDPIGGCARWWLVKPITGQAPSIAAALE